MWILLSSTITLVFLLGVFLMVYGYLIEPHMIEISHYRKNHGQMEDRHLRVVQISDIHLGYHVSIKSFEHLVQQVNALSPDVVVLTGDIYDNGEKYVGSERVVKCLQALKAPYGKYAIYGNHEYAHNGVTLLKQTADQAEITLLVNEVAQVPHPHLKIAIAGADCAIYGDKQPDFCATLESSHFNLLMLHQADAIQPYLKYPIDLVMSGHTHGGQIKLPLLGAPILPEMGKRYLQGWYRFEENPRLELYVNRGFGMTMLPFRFLSRPEITVIDLT